MVFYYYKILEVSIIMFDFSVYHIQCNIFTLKNIALNNLYEEISTYVDSVLVSDEKMKLLHTLPGYSYYSISGFNVIEPDKIYKEGKIYTFSLRCLKEDMCNFFLKNLGEGKTDSMKGLTATMKVIPRRYIEKLYTVTPAIIKLGGEGYWRGVLSLEEYENRLLVNSIKKYQQLTGKQLDENFKLYDGIRFLNRKPISSHYTKKGISLLGDKLELDISSNEMSQEVAYMLLATGVLENNARGFGFVNYRSI